MKHEVDQRFMKIMALTDKLRRMAEQSNSPTKLSVVEQHLNKIINYMEDK